MKESNRKLDSLGSTELSFFKVKPQRGEQFELDMIIILKHM